MERYELVYLPSIQKDLRKLPKAIVRKILARAEKLRDTPFPRDSVKLTGYDNRYRLRQGDYRILYSVDGARILVTVVQIGHRREIYKH
jgi:mRNA interferase RelE/StbE